MNRMPFNSWKLVVILCFISLLQACKDDSEPSADNAYVNSWIQENMQFWYYWNNQLPGNPNKANDPQSFFESLLFTNEDRFSVIYDDYEEILNALDGVSKEAGYEFVLYRESETNQNVFAQVLYIKPNAPASTTVLKRGDKITHINGVQITISNYRSLIEKTSENHTITYQPLTVESVSVGSFGSPITISLNAVTYEENPNFLSTVFNLGDKKAGYYIYNFFASGISGGEQYNNEMNQIMADFKNQGVTDLIVDLRYNGGGYVDASVNLASLLGKGVDETKVFTRREFNPDVVNEFNLTEADLTQKFKLKSENVGNSLSGNLYILTGPRTASASELIINGLRPFMNVILIGEQTVGKNVGSYPLYEKNSFRNRWLMLPTVMRSYNSANQSEYGNGFTPETFVDEGIYLYPLGDPEEPLLSVALAQITGGPGRLALPQTKSALGKQVGSSLDLRKNAARNTLIENINP